MAKRKTFTKEFKAEAARWYRKSSDQGFGLASNNLGGIFFGGRGRHRCRSEGGGELVSKSRAAGLPTQPIALGAENKSVIFLP